MKDSYSRDRALVALLGLCLTGLLSCSSATTKPSTNWTQADLPFDISPNKRFVLYRHAPSRDARQGVYILDLEEAGGVPELLWEFETGFDIPNDPRYSPDGSKLAMTKNFSEDILVFDLETQEETQITFSGGNAKNPDWHPNGKLICYAGWRSASDPSWPVGLVILDLDSGKVNQVTANGEVFSAQNPRWSPDGSKIALASGALVQGQSVWHVWVVTPDGTSKIDMTPNSTRRQRAPEWLSNTEIVFRSEGNGNDVEYLVVNINTRQVRPFNIKLHPSYSRLVVSRDGGQVVYNQADPGGEYGVLYIQDSDDSTGTTRKQLTSFLPIEN